MKTGMGKSSRVPNRPNKSSQTVRGWADDFGALEAGYTVLEVLIFLAVTTALFVMIAVSFQSYQSRTEFSVAIREMETQMRDVANDVSSGYYGARGDFACSVDSTGGIVVDESPGAARPTGTNPDCIFLGKILHFGVEADNDKSYNVMTIIGKRVTANGSLTDSYASQAGARPTVLRSATEDRKLPIGLVFGGMKRAHSSQDVDAVAFLSTLGSFEPDGNTKQDIIRIQYVVPLPYNAISSDASTVDDVMGYIQGFEGQTNDSLAARVITDKIDVCFDSDGTNQHVVYSVDASKSIGSIDTQVRSDKCADDGF